MIEFQKEEKIGIIWFPSFSYLPFSFLELRDSFYDLCKEIEMDDEIVSVIITAKEGMKKKNIRLKPYLSTLLDFPIERIRFTDALIEIDRPVIAAIPENAIGIGLEIVLACDIRIATHNSFFSLPHIKEKLIPWDGGTQRLPRIVGRTKALELLLTGKKIDAKEAQNIGLIHHIFQKERLLDETKKIAKRLASNAPWALRFIREAVYRGVEQPIDQALRMEGDLYLLLFSTEDREEGIKAFREKRKPSFKGK